MRETMLVVHRNSGTVHLSPVEGKGGDRAVYKTLCGRPLTDRMWFPSALNEDVTCQRCAEGRFR